MKAIEIILGILVVIVAFGGLFYWISSYMSSSTDNINEKSDNFLNGKIGSGKLAYSMDRHVSGDDSYYTGNLVKLNLPVSFESFDDTKDLTVTFLVDTNITDGITKEVKTMTFNSTGVDNNKIATSYKSLSGDGAGVTLQLNSTNSEYGFFDIISVDYDGTSFDVE